MSEFYYGSARRRPEGKGWDRETDPPEGKQGVPEFPKDGRGQNIGGRNMTQTTKGPVQNPKPISYFTDKVV